MICRKIFEILFFTWLAVLTQIFGIQKTYAESAMNDCINHKTCIHYNSEDGSNNETEISKIECSSVDSPEPKGFVGCHRSELGYGLAFMLFFTYMLLFHDAYVAAIKCPTVQITTINKVPMKGFKVLVNSCVYKNASDTMYRTISDPEESDSLLLLGQNSYITKDVYDQIKAEDRSRLISSVEEDYVKEVPDLVTKNISSWNHFVSTHSKIFEKIRNMVMRNDSQFIFAGIVLAFVVLLADIIYGMITQRPELIERLYCIIFKKNKIKQINNESGTKSIKSNYKALCKKVAAIVGIIGVSWIVYKVIIYLVAELRGDNARLLPQILDKFEHSPYHDNKPNPLFIGTEEQALREMKISRLPTVIGRDGESYMTHSFWEQVITAFWGGSWCWCWGIDNKNIKDQVLAHPDFEQEIYGISQDIALVRFIFKHWRDNKKLAQAAARMLRC